MRNTENECLNIAFIKAKINNLNLIKMNNTKSKFEVLVSKMETLNETQQGKLKGGITTLSSGDLALAGTNTGCVEINILFCRRKGKDKGKDRETVEP